MNWFKKRVKTGKEAMKCPRCQSTHVIKSGGRVTIHGKKPRSQCQECGMTFYTLRKDRKEKARK